MEPSTPKLLAQASRGDKTALDALLQRHLPGLVAFVRLRAGTKLRARESSVDIVQSACREVLQDLDQVQGLDESAFRNWLYTAAERKIVDRARYWGAAKREMARDVQPGVTDEELPMMIDACASFYTPSALAVAREELERMEAAFQQLPDDYREVIVWSRVVGLSHAEIGRKLDRSEGAVRILLHRALARLERLMRPGA